MKVNRKQFQLHLAIQLFFIITLLFLGGCEKDVTVGAPTENKLFTPIHGPKTGGCGLWMLMGIINDNLHTIVSK